jgi:hypothetical protein
MNSSGAFILLVSFVSVAVVALLTITVFRFVIRKLGIKELVEEGIVLTESGIEFPRFMYLGRCKASYQQIESVELVPFPKNLTLRLRYGTLVSSGAARWNPCLDTIVIKLKPPCFIECHIVTPSNPTALFERIKSRMEQSAHSHPFPIFSPIVNRKSQIFQMQPPLALIPPLPEGEGRGEGEGDAPITAVHAFPIFSPIANQKSQIFQMQPPLALIPPLPEGEGRGEGEGDAPITAVHAFPIFSPIANQKSQIKNSP